MLNRASNGFKPVRSLLISLHVLSKSSYLFFIFCLLLLISLTLAFRHTDSHGENENNKSKITSSPEWYLLVQDIYPPGLDIEYSIFYRNVGDAPATNAVMVDSIDAQTELVWNTGGGLYDPNSRSVAWILGTIEPGKGSRLNVWIKIKEGTSYGTEISNTVVITCDESISRDTTLIITFMPYPIPKVKKTTFIKAPYSGQEMVYGIDYGNVGDTTATNVILTDYLPEEVTFISCTHDGVLDPSEERVLWRLGDLQPNDPSSLPDIQLTVLINSTFRGTTIVDNMVCLTWTERPSWKNLCSETTDTIASPPVLACSIKGRDSFVQAGDEMLYMIQCENSGWNTVHSVVITDSLPIFTEYVACSGGGLCDSPDRKVIWNVEELRPQEDVTFTLIVYVRSPIQNRTSIVNKVWVTSTEGFSFSTAETTIVLSAPAWDLFIAASTQEVIRGQPLTFTTRVRNIGNMNATNTVVTNPIPEYITYSRNTGGGVFDSDENKVTWNIGQIKIDEEKEISLTILVNPDFPTDKEVVNRVYVQSDEKTDSVSIFLPLMLPECFRLRQNYPNPFNPETDISYQLPVIDDQTSHRVTLKIFNILGQEVRSLVEEVKEAGQYFVTWNGRDDSGQEMPSGVYFYRLSVNSGKWSETKRMVFMK